MIGMYRCAIVVVGLSLVGCGGEGGGGEAPAESAAAQRPAITLSSEYRVVAEAPTETGAVAFVFRGAESVGAFEFGTTLDPRKTALSRLGEPGTPLEQYMALTGVDEASAPAELVRAHRAQTAEPPRALRALTDPEIVRLADKLLPARGDGLVDKDAYFAGEALICPWQDLTAVTALWMISQGATGTIFDHCSQGSNSTHCQKANDSWAQTGAIRNGYARGLGICNASGGGSIMQLILTFRDLNGWHDHLFGWWEIPSGFWVTWAHKGNVWEQVPEYYRVYHDAVGVTASAAVYSAF